MLRYDESLMEIRENSTKEKIFWKFQANYNETLRNFHVIFNRDLY